jgi:arylsulfatase A-like enzyme
MDAQVGYLLDTMDRLKLWENTIVLMFGEDVACPRLVEFVDIFPTLTELCGLPAPEPADGISFVPLLRDPQRPWKKAAFTTVVHGNTTELYDHEVDMHEFTNLAFAGKDSRAKQELSAILHEGWRAALPPDKLGK